MAVGRVVREYTLVALGKSEDRLIYGRSGNDAFKPLSIWGLEVIILYFECGDILKINN